ncbi:alpha/beta fold hydrolase [Streptosporangium algeriense]|uniref:Alpha/beta fold hydrolase n=1 Tax=Streptosporangium algeriense TaxID=1682748 RepID=A0ABW3DV12_9ACTN
MTAFVASPAERYAQVNGRRLAYVDYGGDGVPILAMIGHFGRARMFAPLAAALAPAYRVISLEQRGHGHSDTDGDFSREAYVADAAAFVRHLALSPVITLGHSMGGVTAYQLAARHPELVRALVIEEAGAYNRQPEIPHPVLDVTGWPRRTATLRELRRQVEAHGIPDASYFMESAVEHADGWGFLFDFGDMMASQRALVGDWWGDWLGSRCPALLVHGTDSFILPTTMVRQMAERRPNTVLRELSGCGHWVHDDDPDGYATAVCDFLDDL